MFIRRFACLLACFMLAFFGGSRSATAQTPSAPTGVTIHGSTASMTLTWSAVASAVSYNLYRGTSSNGESATAIATGVTATTYTNSGLTNGTRYYYKITAVGSGGAESARSSEVTEVPVGQCTTFTAHAGNTQITLSWNFPAGAVSYRLFRGTSVGGEGATPLVAGLTGLSYTDTGLTNGTTYYYQVTAMRGDTANPGSESTRSAEISATPEPPPPVAPTSVNAIPGNNQVVLSWNASATATSYSVKRGTFAGGTYSTITTLSGLTYTDTGVTNGNTYYYVITASNVGGESANSSEVSATPGSSSSGGNGLSAIADTVVMQFNPTTNYGTIGNVYTRSDTNNLKYSYFKFNLSGASGTITNATLKVYGSANVAGTDTAWGVTDTGWSETGITWNTKPSLTQSLSSASIGTTQQTYSWDVTSWVQAQQAAGNSLVSLGLSMTSSNANASSTYFSRESGYQNRPVLVVTVGGPVAPHLTAIGGIRQISLSWTASPGATSYNVKRSATAGGTYTALNGGSPVTGTSFVDTSLGNGITYYYVVSANNTNGAGPNSNEASASTLALPTTPNPLTATVGNTQVVLSWGTSSGATSYNVYRGLSSGGELSTPIQTGLTATTWTNTGLTNGTTYYYVVKAANAAGESGATNEVHATPSTALSGSSISCGGTISGALTSTDIASPTQGTGYYADLYSFTSVAGRTVHITVNTTTFAGAAYLRNANGDVVASVPGGYYLYPPYYTPSITYNTPADGTYYLEVTTYNAGATGAYTVTLNCADNPPTPQNLTATPGNAQISLSWSDSAGATNYNLKRSLVSGGPYTTIASGLTTAPYIDSGLTNGTAYYYVVSAVNSLGESPDSYEVSATPVAPPSAPNQLVAVPANKKVYLSWSDTSSVVYWHTLYRSTVAGGPYTSIGNVYPSELDPTGLSYTDTGLTNGVTYYYVVTAHNIGGDSGYSNEASATPQASPTSPISCGETITGTISATDPVSNANGPGWQADSYTFTATAGKTVTITLTPDENAYPYLTVFDADGNSVAYGNGTPSVAVYYVSTSGTYTVEATASSVSLPVGYSLNLTCSDTPPTPLNLTATGVNSQVWLNWTPGFPGLTYSVRRALVSGGPYTQIDTTTNSGYYTDTTVVNGTAYYYVVTAIGALGESENSNEASATPLGPPNPPTQLTATPSYKRVYLSWTPSTSVYTGCSVYRSTTSGGPYDYVGTPYPTAADPTGSTYVDQDPNLTPGVTYYYVVRASNVAGVSGPSNEASAALASVTTVSLSCGQTITGSFAATDQLSNKFGPGHTADYYSFAGTAGKTITITLTPSSGTGALTLFGPTTTEMATDTGSPVSLSYFVPVTGTYTVEADGVDAASGDSYTISLSCSDTLPAPTLGGHADDAVNTLYWAPPVSSPYYVGYKLKRSLTPGGPYTVIYTSPDSDNGDFFAGTGYQDTDVSNNTTYYYVVSAFAPGALDSPNSNELALTPRFPAPVLLEANPGSGIGEIVLTWFNEYGSSQNPTVNIKRADASGGPYTTIASGLPTGGNNNGGAYTDTTAVEAQTYYYQVTYTYPTGESLSPVVSAAPKNFVLTVDPSTLTMAQGDSTSLMIKAAAFGGFYGDVAITFSAQSSVTVSQTPSSNVLSYWLSPSLLTIPNLTPIPSNIAPPPLNYVTSTLYVCVGNEVPVGTVTNLLVTGTAGPVSHTVSIPFTVTAGGPFAGP